MPAQQNNSTAYRLTNPTDVARVREQLDKARDARDSLTLEAEKAEQRLVGLVEEVKRAEANYDFLLGALGSAKHEVGKWRATLRKNGKSKRVVTLQPSPSLKFLHSDGQLSNRPFPY